jgi:subtilisin family serine protease
MKWQKSFPSLLDRYFDRSQERSSRALKLAILDTGIDASHCYFDNEPRIVEKKSWVTGPAHVDNSGHGTHIAGIVLDLTRNVDLYIARITNKRHLKDMDAISEVYIHCP